MKVQNTILYSTPTHTILVFIFFFFFFFVIAADAPRRVECPVPIHCASRCPLDTKKLPVLDLEALETCIMTIKINRTATMLKKTGQINDTEKSHSLL